MARIFITGDRGFFGSRFHSVYDGVHEVQGVDVPEMDIVDPGAVTAAVAAFGPDLVLHAAAVTSTEFADRNPELARRINVDGAVNVARAASDAGARMILFSTEQVFNGNPEPGPYGEDVLPVPNTMYGETKLEAERRVSEVVEDLWILRFTWLFGLPERNMPVNPNILWNSLQLALAGRRTDVATNEFRGHTYGYDMISNVLNVPDLPPGVYHLGSRTDLDRYDVTCHVLRELGLGERIDDLIAPDRQKYAAAPRDVRLDTSRAAGLGISFDETPVALSRALSEFGLLGALS